MNIHKYDLLLLNHLLLDFQGYTAKIWRYQRKRNKIINMQKLWRRNYNINVNKYELPLAASCFYKNILYERVIFYHF